MKRKIIETEDGSHTLALQEVDEHYHSIHGAINESSHIFIGEGFQKADKWLNPLNILEVGFGTGLNALLTYKAHLSEKRKINYVAVEPYPLTTKEIELLNYPKIADIDKAEHIFSSLHKSIDSPYFIGERFIMLHLNEKIQDIKLKENSFNLIYYDAFAPAINPELWEKSIFEKMYHALESRGILVTYSASGNVKRALKEAGFSLNHPKGPQGKREITVARKESSLNEIFS
ncbi:MAG: tRNA (5-methylaminomethyl-2-thiouridine)(34)-methyltransferase MnmD [Bacteroidales bacterium]